MFVRIRKRASRLWADTSLEVILVKNYRLGLKVKQESWYLGCIRSSRIGSSFRQTMFWRKVRGALDTLSLPLESRKSIEEKIIAYVPMPAEMGRRRGCKVPPEFQKKMNSAFKRLDRGR